MNLQDTGAVLLEANEPDAGEESAVASALLAVSLVDGYTAGYVGLDVEVVEGSPGHRLKIILLNKTEIELTVNVPGGDLDLECDMPVDALMVTFEKARMWSFQRERAVNPFRGPARDPRYHGRTLLAVRL